MTISADVDFVLRAIEASENVAHVPAVLYRWRTHGSSAGHTMLDLVTDATVGALNRHIKRLEIDAVAAPGFHFNNHRIDYADDRQRVAIVIPTKDRHDLVKACVDSIRSTTIASEVEIVIIDHDSSDPDSRNYFDEIRSFCTIIPYSGAFNYAKINNFAVNSLNFYHKYIIFMNNDVEVIEAGWLERMRSVAARKEVGVVGATLLYPDRTVQHSGVIMGLGTLADHAHKYIPIGESSARNPGYNGSLTSLRDYTAVTGACMMMRREVFLGVGGFDPKQEIGYNDTDLCLRIGSLGYKVLCDPYAVLYHHESASRRLTNQIDHPDDGMRLAARWAKILEKGDPYYNPLLVHASGMDHRVGDLDNWWHAPRVRPVRPTLRPLSEGTPEAIDAVTRSKCNGL